MTIANFVASIPSPPDSTIDLGFARIHYYALFILLGIVVAVYWSNRRLVKRGGESGLMLDVAIWAVPIGIVGARLFHVVTHLSDYVGEGKDLLKILYVWEGGLAIYGGLIFGVLGAYLGARQAGLKLLSVADALAPAVLLAQ
ncbi:MAG: prolipoprotein diacylglyceryl transferase, partial [Actinobacteria bacterium]|nr:prolipoprotein diacylglyceryl transferase [Actinomycetota bacterium]